MEKIYEIFYSGGVVNLNKQNNYSTQRGLSKSLSQPQLSMNYTRDIYPNNEYSYYTNKKFELLADKIIELENEKNNRQNEMIKILIEKLNNKYKNNINGNNEVQQVILPPIPIIQQIPFNHSYSTVNMMPYDIESNNFFIRDKFSDFLNHLNSKIDYDNYSAMNKIQNLENDYRNVSQILENKIDQINHQYQLNFDLLLKAIENKRSNSSFNKTKSSDNKNNLNNINIKKMIQDEIRKKLEMKRRKEFENLRTQNDKNHINSNSSKIIEKIFPVVLEEKDMLNYLTRYKINKKTTNFSNENETKTNKRKKIKYKLSNTKSTNILDKSRKITKISKNNNNENNSPIAKYLIRKK